MAEAALIFSFLDLAAEGLKISETISAFLDRFHSASKDIHALVTDVQSTSETLKQLADCLGKHENSDLANEEWKSNTEAHLSTCQRIFSDIQSTISDSKCSQLHFGTSFSRLKRFKAAFKHEKVINWRVRLDSLKTDFIFKLNVLNLARRENERQTASIRLKKKAELDRLEYEKESLGLEIAYKQKKFAQLRAAQLPSTSTRSDSDFGSSSDEEDAKESGNDAGKKAFQNRTTASQPVSEQKHESRPRAAKEGLIARRRRNEKQTGGSQGRSSLRLDLLSSLEELLPRNLEGTVDQDSLRALIQALQAGEAKEGLTTSPLFSSTLAKEQTASDQQLEAGSNCKTAEPKDDNEEFDESDWESDNEETATNTRLSKNARNAQLPRFETTPFASNTYNPGQWLLDAEMKGSPSSHRNTELDGFTEIVAPEPVIAQYFCSNQTTWPYNPKGTVVNSVPGLTFNEAMVAANSPSTTVFGTSDSDRMGSGVHISEPNDVKDARISQPEAEKPTMEQESAAKFVPETTSRDISQWQSTMKASAFKKIAYPEKDHEDPGTVNSGESERSPSIEAWSLREPSFRSKLGLGMLVKGSSLWAKLHLHEDDLFDITDNKGAADSLWQDIALLSNYQKKQIDRLISMRRKQDKQTESTKFKWFLQALNSHPHNVSNGSIVNLVVVIERRFVGPGELGFDFYGHEPLPENIAKLTPKVGESIVQKSPDVPGHAHNHRSKKSKVSKAMVDPDPFWTSKFFTPSGKPLATDGYLDQCFDEVPGPSMIVPLPPPIEQDKPIGRIIPYRRGSKKYEDFRYIDESSVYSYERPETVDFDSLFPIGKKGKKARSRSRSRSRFRSRYPRTRRRSLSSSRTGDSDSEPIDLRWDASDDWYIDEPISRKYGAGRGRFRNTNRMTVAEDADSNYINQLLQRWTYVEQDTLGTQMSQRCRKRTEKRAKMQEHSYVSSSDTEDERTFPGAEGVKVGHAQPNDLGNGTTKPVSPKDVPNGKTEGHPGDQKIDADLNLRERELEKRERNLARRERLLLGLPVSPKKESPDA